MITAITIRDWRVLKGQGLAEAIALEAIAEAQYLARRLQCYSAHKDVYEGLVQAKDPNDFLERFAVAVLGVRPLAAGPDAWTDIEDAEELLVAGNRVEVLWTAGRISNEAV